MNNENTIVYIEGARFRSDFENAYDKILTQIYAQGIGINTYKIRSLHDAKNIESLLNNKFIQGPNTMKWFWYMENNSYCLDIKRAK